MSFAAAFSERYTNQTRNLCPCTNSDITWPHQTPPFMGRDYFCDTNSRNAVFSNGWSAENNWLDERWDGDGCGPTSSCCTFNNPPYFCKKQPAMMISRWGSWNLLRYYLYKLISDKEITVECFWKTLTK